MRFTLDYCQRLLVVIDKLDFIRIAILPAKTDSPLPIDANAVLSTAIAFELLEAIAWRHFEVRQRLRRIQDQQLSQRHPLDVHGQPLGWLTLK